MILLRFHTHGLPNQTSSIGPPEQCALAISALAQSLILRFRYHFDGKRQTNRLDKPEWYFAHILNALHDHESFIQHEVQSLLKQGGLNETDAMTDFITALLRPLTKKIRASMPQLLGMPSILAHTLYQALHFDHSIRNAYSYSRRLADGKTGEWKGTADIVLGNKAWFDGWRESERKCKIPVTSHQSHKAEGTGLCQLPKTSSSKSYQPRRLGISTKTIHRQLSMVSNLLIQPSKSATYSSKSQIVTVLYLLSSIAFRSSLIFRYLCWKVTCPVYLRPQMHLRHSPSG